MRYFAEPKLYRNFILFSLLGFLISFVEAMEQTNQIPSVKEQVKLYASIFQEHDNPAFDPYHTPVPRLSEALVIAHVHVRQAIGEKEVQLGYLEKGMHFIASTELTMNNFLIYNYYLGFILTDLVKDRLDAKDLKDFEDENWQDIESFFPQFKLFPGNNRSLRRYPFCFIAPIYTPTGRFSFDEYFDATFPESGPILSLVGVPYWANGPHGGQVAAPFRCIDHDRAHSESLFRAYDVDKGNIYWQHMHKRIRKILDVQDANSKFRKQMAFLLSHEEPYKYNTFGLSAGIEDMRVLYLPHCEKKMFLNSVLQAAQMLDLSRYNASSVLAGPIERHLYTNPIVIDGHKVSIRIGKGDLGIKGPLEFVQQLTLSLNGPDVSSYHHTPSYIAELVGSIEPTNSVWKEKLTVREIKNLKINPDHSHFVQQEPPLALIAELAGINFEMVMTSRWWFYTTYLHDPIRIIVGAHPDFTNIRERSVSQQIDAALFVLRQFYHSYVGIFSEEEIEANNIPPASLFY